MFTRVKVHRDFHAGVIRSVDSAPKEYLDCLDARADLALVKLFHHGVLVKTDPGLRRGGKCLSGPPRRGISAIAATRSSGLRSRRLGCFARPAGLGGNDHGGFRSQFGQQVFEKLVGTAGFEPATP